MLNQMQQMADGCVPDDPHSTKVFDPSIKGDTDRFAFRFVKI